MVRKKVLTYLWVLICKGDPILLITVFHPLELAPVVPHHLLVVVRDEGLEDYGLLRCARIDLCKQGID